MGNNLPQYQADDLDRRRERDQKRTQRRENQKRGKRQDQLLKLDDLARKFVPKKPPYESLLREGGYMTDRMRNWIREREEWVEKTADEILAEKTMIRRVKEKFGGGEPVKSGEK